MTNHRCECTCADRCPLGRSGMALRCTTSELIDEINRLQAKNSTLLADNRFLEAMVKDAGEYGNDFRDWFHWVGGDDGYVAQRDRDAVEPSIDAMDKSIAAQIEAGNPGPEWGKR